MSVKYQEMSKIINKDKQKYQNKLMNCHNTRNVKMSKKFSESSKIRQ